MSLNRFLELSVFAPEEWSSRDISEVISWQGHIPFAFTMIRLLKPPCLVELGTHKGDSYLAFCEAVERYSSGTRCFAVDTWKGDAHAGYYGDEVLEQLRSKHDDRYSGFSTLIRSTFDDALAQFSDGSIDLLHIDGLHTYDAVRHDFEAWKSKLSEHGIVLFHDTQVRQANFGVWQYWAELCEQFPSFEFYHSNGLGVLGVGREAAELLPDLFDADDETASRIRSLHSVLGNSIAFHGLYKLLLLERNMAAEEIARLDALLHEERKEAEAEKTRLNGALVDCESKLAQVNQEKVSLAKLIEKERRAAASEIARLNSVMIEREPQLAQLTQEKSSLIELFEVDRRSAVAEIARLIEVTVESEEQIASLNQDLSEREGQIAELMSETISNREWALRLEGELNEERVRLLEIIQGNSWRITLPLREMRRWLNAPKQQVSRYKQGGVRLAKQVYQSLPLSYRTKAAHRNALARYFPKLLLMSGSHSATIPVLALPKMKQLISAQYADPADLAKTIEIPLFQNPQVSVIIPIYGQIDYTLRCLASIFVNSPQTSYEVIIVDDCSPDNSFEILSAIKGVRLLRNEQNQGFIRSCNFGANAAYGEYLYFLNNDTEVTSGWMDELLRTFHEFPGTGLAGSKLIYPDGKLQEAGGIIWQDGSAWNFGRLQDPQLPVFNYAREVDYCSGASIMVPKALFDYLGGFDENYLPAYCEDSDLALKIRDNEFRVIYQPLSVVVHYEGMTSGTDITQGTKAYQVENLKKQFQRWKNRLIHHQAPGIDVDNAKDRMAKRRVLVMDHCTPTPNQDSGSIDTFNILLLLREMGFQATFIPEHNFLFLPDYTPDLQRIGVEVLYAPYCTSVDQHLKEFGGRYDLVFLFRVGVVEQHLKSIRNYCSKAKVLFHTVDLHHIRMSREAELFNDETKQQVAEKMKESELSAMRAVDTATVISSAELEWIRKELPNEKIHFLPFSRSIRGTEKGYHERRDIVFVGGYEHQPNVDAVQYFVNKVMPLLRPRLHGIRFYIVGSKVPEEIYALAAEDVFITGFVEVLNPFLDKMRVSVAPLRYGAGIKGKIGSAMTVGLPTIATSLAAEGMSLTNEEHILIADSPETFADAVVRLYQGESLWNRLSRNSLKFAESTWGAEAAWKVLHEILADISINTIRGKYPLSLFSESERAHKEIKKQFIELTPIAVIQNREDYKLALQSDSLKQIKWIEKTLIESSNTEEFAVNGFCVPCGKKVAFVVDMQSGGQCQGNIRTPNWRERLECPLCRMNNRQRLIATLVKQELDLRRNKHVYFMEQVTPIYNWAIATFNNHTIVGSEYLGYEYEGGAIIKGIRHENIESLSFTDGALDLIVSNDVFEHVPNPTKAFAECARVLKNGGVMLATIPFHHNSDESINRAKIVNGQLKHVFPPSFHGNPVSADGSLVFTDFGWDILDLIRTSGFFDVRIEVYASEEWGHLGGGQLVFRASKYYKLENA